MLVFRVVLPDHGDDADVPVRSQGKMPAIAGASGSEKRTSTPSTGAGRSSGGGGIATGGGRGGGGGGGAGFDGTATHTFLSDSAPIRTAKASPPSSSMSEAEEALLRADPEVVEQRPRGRVSTPAKPTRAKSPTPTPTPPSADHSASAPSLRRAGAGAVKTPAPVEGDITDIVVGYSARQPSSGKPKPHPRTKHVAQDFDTSGDADASLEDGGLVSTSEAVPFDESTQEAHDAVYDDVAVGVSRSSSAEPEQLVRVLSKTPGQLVAALEQRVNHLARELGDVTALLMQLKASISANK